MRTKNFKLLKSCQNNAFDLCKINSVNWSYDLRIIIVLNLIFLFVIRARFEVPKMTRRQFVDISKFGGLNLKILLKTDQFSRKNYNSVLKCPGDFKGINHSDNSLIFFIPEISKYCFYERNSEIAFVIYCLYRLLSGYFWTLHTNFCYISTF